MPEFDEDGFLIDMDDWSETLARNIALTDGVSLGDEHFKVLMFIRDFYRRFGTSPMPKAIIKAINAGGEGPTLTVKRLYRLFPSFRHACKYAGVKPTGCT